MLPWQTPLRHFAAGVGALLTKLLAMGSGTLVMTVTWMSTCWSTMLSKHVAFYQPHQTEVSGGKALFLALLQPKSLYQQAARLAHMSNQITMCAGALLLLGRQDCPPSG